MTTIEILLLISSSELAEEERAAVSPLSTGNTAFGRMGKTVQRILALGKETLAYQDQISEESRREITILGRAIYEVLQLTIRGFEARRIPGRSGPAFWICRD